MKNKATITPHQLIELGKIPPQAVDMESVVLGALLIDRGVIEAVLQILPPESYYKEAHQRIANAIRNLHVSGEPADIMTVVQELKRTGELEIAGGAFYVTQLTNRISSSANSEYHARIVKQKFIQRELIRVATNTLQCAYQDNADVFELMGAHQKMMDHIDGTMRAGKEIKSMQELSEQVMTDYNNREKARKNGEVTGVTTGLEDLDKATGGWQKSNLIIMASRPGVGKSALACFFAISAAEAGFDVLFDSVEMKATELYGRMLMMKSKLWAQSFKYANYSSIDKETMVAHNMKLAKLKIHIDDEPATDISHTLHKARKIKKTGNLGLIVCDYLQLKEPPMGVKLNSREQEISLISRGLKGMAKEMDCPVIALSSLSRDVEKRGGEKRPILSDLRESGAIEHDADIVMFPYRPGYYNKSDESLRGLGEIIIAKHRNGALEDVLFRHNESMTDFKNMDEPTAAASLISPV